ncbi:MAG: sugar phosphate isomerase/epimerase, partial [Clostridia bacterium]|nr:sugar phosphate isomerase/epimerase [Clostridia bacterium]
MPPTLAIQIFSVSTAYKADPAGTLQKLKDLGYQAIEMCWPHTVEEARTLRANADAAGLEIF